MVWGCVVVRLTIVDNWISLDILATDFDILDNWFFIHFWVDQCLQFLLLLNQFKSIHVPTMAWLDSLKQVEEFGSDLGETNLRDGAKLRIDRHSARSSLWLNYVEIAVLFADLISSDIFLIDWNGAFSLLLVHLLGNLTTRLLLIIIVVKGSRACDFQIADGDHLL